MTDWLIEGTEPRESWLPSTADIGAFLYARLNVRVSPGYGVSVDQLPDENDLPDFSDKTRPTKLRVEKLIELTAPRIGVIVGNPCDPAAAELARLALIVRVCASSEIGGYVRASNGSESAYKALKEEADEIAAELRTLDAELGQGDQPGSADNTGLMAGSFPVSPLSVVGCDGYLRPRAL